MSQVQAPPVQIESVGEGQTRSFRLLRRLAKRPVAMVAICVIIVVYGTGILAPWIAPYGFNEADFTNRLAGPSWEHPLGTDRLGRDLLSRIMWSAQTTVIISVAVVATGGLLLGVTLGLLAGYARGIVDGVIMRAGEMFASVPTILLLVIINVTLLGRVRSLFRDLEDLTGLHWLVSSGAPSYFLVFGALSIFSWVGIARIVRSQVLSIREADYVTAARASGARTGRILFRHLLPNITNILLVAFTATLGAAALAEVGLTFLGIGVEAPHPSFGAMIWDASGVTTLRAHPHLLIVPAVVVAALMLSFNLLGDVLTDVMSPRRR